MDIFCLAPRIVSNVLKNSEVNLTSLSLTNDSGIPCFEIIWSTVICAKPAASIVRQQGWIVTYLVSLSTHTIMQSNPLGDVGRHEIKSIEIDCHAYSGISRGCNGAPESVKFGLFNWHDMQLWQ